MNTKQKKKKALWRLERYVWICFAVCGLGIGWEVGAGWGILTVGIGVLITTFVKFLACLVGSISASLKDEISATLKDAKEGESNETDN